MLELLWLLLRLLCGGHDICSWVMWAWNGMLEITHSSNRTKALDDGIAEYLRLLFFFRSIHLLEAQLDGFTNSRTVLITAAVIVIVISVTLVSIVRRCGAAPLVMTSWRTAFTLSVSI